MPHFQPKYLFIIFALFSSTWLASNIAAIKLISIFSITLTGGFIVFPFTTIFNYIIVEIYGYKNSRQVIWSGALFNITFILFMYVVNIIPADPHWKLQTEFHDILVPSIRIIAASILSFLLSDFVNNYIMATMKKRKKSWSLVKRIIISSIIAITIDLTSFFIFAFLWTMPLHFLLKIFLSAFIKRMLCQIILLPIIWYLIDVVKTKEGFEIYDYGTNFTPFSLDNVYDFNAYKEYKKEHNNKSTNIKVP